MQLTLTLDQESPGSSPGGATESAASDFRSRRFPYCSIAALRVITAAMQARI
jgi:hypothetical protein